MAFSKKDSTAVSSLSWDFRRVISSRCSGLSATCCVSKTMSIRFFPIVPERVLRRMARICSLSSWLIIARDWSNRERISPLALT